ncbi:MAG TPA: type IV pilin protein [Steroidobacteraceae bacterium]|nr:type IV pilin protein [Steroidobacteraceae bacterium]
MKPRAGAAGFTLIELMIVVVIASILLSIAIPSYMSQVRESRRTEAKTALLDLAGREESFFSTNGSTYTNLASDLGYAAWPAATPNGYYQINWAGANSSCVAAQGAALACDPNANAPSGPAYYLTATPVGAQANDTQCGTFAVDSLGNQFTTGTLPSAQCWAH